MQKRLFQVFPQGERSLLAAKAANPSRQWTACAQTSTTLFNRNEFIPKQWRLDSKSDSSLKSPSQRPLGKGRYQMGSMLDAT
jgi:hypothetical protein